MRFIVKKYVLLFLVSLTQLAFSHNSSQIKESKKYTRLFETQSRLYSLQFDLKGKKASKNSLVEILWNDVLIHQIEDSSKIKKNYEFKVWGVAGSSSLKINVKGRKKRYSLNKFIKNIVLEEDNSDSEKPEISLSLSNTIVSNDLDELVLSFMDNVGVDYNSLSVLINNNLVPDSNLVVDTSNNMVRLLLNSNFTLIPNAVNTIAVKISDTSANTKTLSAYYDARDLDIIDNEGPIVNFIPQVGASQNLNPLITVALYDPSQINYANFSFKLNDIYLPSSYYQIDSVQNKVNIQLDNNYLLNDESINILEVSVTDQIGNIKISKVSFDTRDTNYSIKNILGVDQSDLDVGNVHTCSIVEGSKVKCWGYGSLGYLGYSSTTTIGDNETPSSVGYVDIGADAVQLVSGDSHNCVLLSDKSVRCWGGNQFGVLGIGSLDSIGDNETPSSIPSLFLGQNIKKLAAGSFHTCALKESGEVICWGLGANGRLGIGSTETIGDDELPSTVASIDLTYPIVDISAGTSHTCALNSNGDVKCWGRNQYKQLGFVTTDIGDDELPSSITALDLGQKAIQISSSSDHTCALLDNHKMKCWGRNDFGQLGYGSVALPASVLDYPFIDIGEDILKVSAGKFTTCIITISYKAKCFGKNDFGQLGIGNTENIGDNELPSSSNYIELGESVVSISASGNHTCAVTISAKMYCFGNGSLGKLGYANNENIGDDELPLSAGAVSVDDVLLSADLKAAIVTDQNFGSVPLSVNFNAQDSSSTSGIITKYTWNFGDGSAVEEQSSGLIAHTYNQVGVYIVSLTVTDENQNTAIVKTAISVSDKDIKPVAILESSTGYQQVSANIEFDAQSSFDPRESSLEYMWNFGDGFSLVSLGATIEHSFIQSGVYLVSLNVRSTDGRVSDTSYTVVYIE